MKHQISSWLDGLVVGSVRVRPVSDWPEDPYPGAWPDHSYVVHEGLVHPIESAEEGWVVDAGPVPTPLDQWLAERGLPGLCDRSPVLSFGSNRCPSKVARQGGPAINLRCDTTGLAAVWSHGVRGDGQVVATLVGRQDHEDWFFLSLCSAAEIAMLDEVEGRGTGYDLVTLEDGLVTLEDGSTPEGVRAYIGLHPHRWPVAGADGSPILLTAMEQDAVAGHRATDPPHWDPAEDPLHHHIGDA